jgi:hypothetical protein
MKLNFLQHKKFFSISSHKKFQMEKCLLKTSIFFSFIYHVILGKTIFRFYKTSKQFNNIVQQNLTKTAVKKKQIDS